MRFLRTCFLILLTYIVLGSAAEASSIIKEDANDAIIASHMHDKKPKEKERKRVVIQISKDVGYVIITILEVVIDVCANNSGCSSYYRYNH
ncbi:hypothetical protein [Cytophaga aurantiaca]|uniref:hypothetical protein n=1 Tax=Cytophaga aurantiaca TaxID=29530 RepID=UPI000361452C|nr:hypothetical protein [Cytophaga aurantiaca]